MRRAILISMMIAALAAGADVIDRIVVVVNRTPILASDCDEQLRFEAFVGGRLPATSPQERDAALDRLIDQALIEQQMSVSRYPAATDAEAEAALEQVRKQIAPDGRWADALRRYGLSEGAVAWRVRRQLNQLRYIELRFHSQAQPTADAVQRYYNDQYLPRLRGAGGSEKPLADVREQIEQVLTEQRIDQLLASWLQTLRSQAQIERRAPAQTVLHTGGGAE